MDSVEVLKPGSPSWDSLSDITCTCVVIAQPSEASALGSFRPGQPLRSFPAPPSQPPGRRLVLQRTPHELYVTLHLGVARDLRSPNGGLLCVFLALLLLLPAALLLAPADERVAAFVVTAAILWPSALLFSLLFSPLALRDELLLTSEELSVRRYLFGHMRVKSVHGAMKDLEVVRVHVVHKRDDAPVGFTVQLVVGGQVKHSFGSQLSMYAMDLGEAEWLATQIIGQVAQGP